MPNGDLGNIMGGKKIENKILPPDPGRILGNILNIPADLEHATPLPPLIERAHKRVYDFIETELPRLDQMGEFERKEVGEYFGYR